MEIERENAVDFLNKIDMRRFGVLTDVLANQEGETTIT